MCISRRADKQESLNFRMPNKVVMRDEANINSGKRGDPFSSKSRFYYADNRGCDRFLRKSGRQFLNLKEKKRLRRQEEV